MIRSKVVSRGGDISELYYCLFWLDANHGPLRAIGSE